MTSPIPDPKSHPKPASVSGLSTRDTLMRAAAELMSEVGYDAMTTAAVAKRAGVAEGTIYRHFASKEALAEAVFKGVWDAMCAAVEAALPPRDQPEERLRHFGVISFGIFMHKPVDAALCNQEHMHWIRTCGLHTLPPGPQGFVALLEEAIRLAQAAGIARPELDPVISAAFIFHGAGHVMERFMRPAPDGTPPLYDPERFTAAMDAFLNAALFLENR